MWNLSASQLARLFPFPCSFPVKRFICHRATLGNTMILREGKWVEGPKLY